MTNESGGSSPRGLVEGLDWAEDRIGTTGYGGMCLQFTREAYGIGSKYEDADDAWALAEHRHSTSSTSSVPTGAPIFFDEPGSRGHVAVYAGGGMMVTTHASSNKIGKDHVSTWTGDYGYTMLGWSEDLNGVRIFKSGDSGGSGGSLTLSGWLDEPTIRAWQKAAGTPVDGHISQPTSKLTSAVQSKLNALGIRDENGHELVVDGKGIYVNKTKDTPENHTSWALQKYLDAAGFTHDGYKPDGYFSAGYKIDGNSSGIIALQKMLNAGKWGHKP